MVERTIKISPNGDEVVFLYNDKIPWKEIGEMKSFRASDILFDEELQKWYIKFPDGREVGYFDLREKAIEEEIYILEKAMVEEDARACK